MSPVRRLEPLIHAAVLAFVFAAAVLGWRLTSTGTETLTRAAERGRRAQELLRGSAELRAVLAQAELGVRSFLLTRRPAYLQGYDAAVDLVPAKLEQVARSATPEQRELLGSLKTLVERRLTALRLFAALDTASPDALRRARAEVDRSARAAQAVQGVLAELDKLGAAELALAESQRLAATRSARRGAALQSALSLGAVLAVFSLFLRQAMRRRRAEDEAAGSEGLMRLVFQSLSEGIIFADASGRALIFNPAAEQMLGGRPPQADTGRWEEVGGLFHEDGRTPLRVDEMPLVRALEGKVTEGLLVCVKTGPGGTCRYLSVTASPVRQENGRLRGGVVLLADVTGRRRSDEEIRRLNRDLRESFSEMSVVNSELESFASSVSHGLRAPLRAVDGFSRLLETSKNLEPEQTRLLSVIRVNAVRMGRLMDDLLAYVDLLRRPLRAARVDMAALVRAEFERAARGETGPAPRLKVYEPLPAARGDPELLRELLANLLTNALKFSRRSADRLVEVGTAGANGKTIYYVRDHGVGFSMRYAHRLFGVFQRLHGADEFEGAGVGLAIVRRIVERHGGQIWANAEEGRGAAFYFTLPPADAEEEEASTDV